MCHSAAARSKEKAPVPLPPGLFRFLEGLVMTEHSRTAARDVHALLLEAHPQVNNDNLAKAAHLAEATGVARDHRQLETFVAIRNLRRRFGLARQSWPGPSTRPD